MKPCDLLLLRTEKAPDMATIKQAAAYAKRISDLEAEGMRYRSAMTAQIRDAVIEIEDGDTNATIARLLTLIGDSPLGDEAQP